MDRGWPQERPNPNPSLVDRRGNAVGLLPSFGVRPMAIATLEEYLREFSVEIGDRILTSFPALHAPGDPVSPILGTLLRKPFKAQEVAIAVAWCHLNEEGHLLEKMIPGSVEVEGNDSDEFKEETFEAFAAGQIRVLVS